MSQILKTLAQTFIALANSARCLMGIHSMTSYAEQLKFDGTKMVSVSRKISNDEVEGFIEISALRCRRCKRTFEAKTKTDWSLLSD